MTTLDTGVALGKQAACDLEKAKKDHPVRLLASRL
jgi:hypothetical protein